MVHPFDSLVVELKHPVLGPLLPDMSYLHETDSVWVLWAPNHLAVWSRKKQGWVDLMFNFINPDEEISEELATLQRAEIRFLDSLEGKPDSPYLFAISK